MTIFCDSCGNRMPDASAHGGGDLNNPYCNACTDVSGKLKGRDDVRAALIKFYVEKYDYPQKAAEQWVDSEMRKMPAWEKK